MTKNLLLLFCAILFLSACGSQAGQRKPNWWIADFDKYGEAYYLSVDKVNIGDTKEVVIRSYGAKYDVLMKGDIETWKYTSYRATGFTDPIDKYVYVDFKNDHVIDVKEELVGRATPSQNTQDPAIALRKLKAMYDEGVISEEDYISKKQDILDRM